MRMLVSVAVIAFACACAPIPGLASDAATAASADKASKVDAYAREQLGIGVDELAWLMGAACEGSVHSTRGLEFIERKHALEKLEQAGYVNLVEFGSPEFVAVCATPKGAAVRKRLLQASR